MHSRLMVTALLSALGLVLATPAAIQAFPEPAAVSPSWNLDFEFGSPEPIAIEDVSGTTQWYWFMPYTVVNNSGSDQLFIPEATLATDAGDIISAGQNVPASLFPRIRQRLRNPLLLSPLEVVGRILQGEDYAKESVIIWPAFDHNVDELTLFISGLSGETQAATNPITGESVLMRRTLMLRYAMPGNPASPQSQPVQLVEQRDVMR